MQGLKLKPYFFLLKNNDFYIRTYEKQEKIVKHVHRIQPSHSDSDSVWACFGIMLV